MAEARGTGGDHRDDGARNSITNHLSDRPIGDRLLDARIVMLSNEVSDESADDPERRTSDADSPLGW